MDSDGSSTVVLTVASAGWRRAFGDLEPLVERVVDATLQRAAGAPWIRAGEVSLLLTDDREIRSLNAAYRSRDRATNVLSFPGIDLVDGDPSTGDAASIGGVSRLSGGRALLGDVAISFERLHEEASAEGKTPRDHFAHLLTHGTLHLLGYDHGDDAEADAMEALETSILETLGVADPYAPGPVADASGGGR